MASCRPSFVSAFSTPVEPAAAVAEDGGDEDADDDDDSAFVDATHSHLIGFSVKSGKQSADTCAKSLLRTA